MANVTLKGNPVQLVGKELKAGDKAPDFVLQNSALQEVSLKDSAGKTRLIASVPSLDTPTCHMESKRFNEEAGKLPNVAVLVVSNDLPFAQKRWGGATGVRLRGTSTNRPKASSANAYQRFLLPCSMAARLRIAFPTPGAILTRFA